MLTPRGSTDTPKFKILKKYTGHQYVSNNMALWSTQILKRLEVSMLMGLTNEILIT